MRRVALTGGIATGKTHVARRLAEQHHVPVIDSDVIVHQALGAGGALVDPIVERFGDAVRLADGGVDRRALAQIIFNDVGARHALEALVHPIVYSRISDWYTALPASTPFAVADIPLLFETGRQGDFDAVVVTACARETQIARVMDRDGATRDEAERRLAAQWPVERKVELADYVIRTDGSKADTDLQIDAVVAKLSR